MNMIRMFACLDRCLSIVPGAVCSECEFLLAPAPRACSSMACAEVSLDSFEQLHYVAMARALAAGLCPQPRVESAVGVWHGQAENSGMIDGCPNDKARATGRPFGEILPPEAGAGFRPQPGRKKLADEFSRQPAARHHWDHDGASQSERSHRASPTHHDDLVLIVAADAPEHANALALSSSLHGQGLQEESGIAEFIGRRTTAREGARCLHCNRCRGAPGCTPAG